MVTPLFTVTPTILRKAGVTFVLPVILIAPAPPAVTLPATTTPPAAVAVKLFPTVDAPSMSALASASETLFALTTDTAPTKSLVDCASVTSKKVGLVPAVIVVVPLTVIVPPI